MSYSIEQWTDRIGGRSDLTSQITHLTRTADEEERRVGPVEILIRMLLDQEIRPSTTESGFICGDRPATCFLDAPLYSIAQNCRAEEIACGGVPNDDVRYLGVGLMFPKPYAYRQGARPVIYEQTEVAKKILPPTEWWRIVRFDLSDNTRIVDWTHEREWRCPGSFRFKRADATVVLPNNKAYQFFLKRCRSIVEVDILNEIHAIVSLGTAFY